MNPAKETPSSYAIELSEEIGKHIWKSIKIADASRLHLSNKLYRMT